MKRLLALVLTIIFISGSLLAAAADESPAMKKGNELEKAGKTADALKEYQAELASKPTEELFRKIGALLGKLQRFDDAEKTVSEGLGKFPTSTSLQNLSGFIKFKQGKKDDAAKVWKSVLEKDSTNSFAKEWLAKTQTSGKSAPPENAANSATTTPSPAEGSEPAAAPAGADFTISTGLSKEDQEKLGEKLYQEMSETEEFEYETFFAKHREVIEKCSQTEWAPNSCWKLSNLYRDRGDEADFPNIIKCCRHLVKNYPDSEFAGPAKNRLLWAFRQTNDHQSLVEIYTEMFQNRDAFPDDQFRAAALEYADALAALGRKADAKPLYEEILKRTKDGEDSLEAQAATDRLKGL